MEDESIGISRRLRKQEESLVDKSNADKISGQPRKKEQPRKPAWTASGLKGYDAN